MWFEGGVHGLERKEFFFQLPAGSFSRGITNADLFFFFTVHTATQPLRTNVTNKSSTIPTPHFPCHLHMFTCFFIVSSNFSRARFPPLNIIFPSLLRRESSPVAAILFFLRNKKPTRREMAKTKKWHISHKEKMHCNICCAFAILSVCFFRVFLLPLSLSLSLSPAVVLMCKRVS